MNSYFFDHKTLVPVKGFNRFNQKGELKQVELIHKLNSTRPKGHFVNKIFSDIYGKVIAVRCNCGKNKCHPVINEEETNWKGEFHEKEILGLRKHEKVLTL